MYIHMYILTHRKNTVSNLWNVRKRTLKFKAVKTVNAHSKHKVDSRAHQRAKKPSYISVGYLLNHYNKPSGRVSTEEIRYSIFVSESTQQKFSCDCKNVLKCDFSYFSEVKHINFLIFI